MTRENKRNSPQVGLGLRIWPRTGVTWDKALVPDKLCRGLSG